MIQIYLNCIAGILWSLLGVAKDFNDFKYIEPEQSLVNKYLKPQKITVVPNAIYALNYLPKSPSKSGNVDYTKFLQKAITENKIIVFPDFPVLINKAGLMVGSEKTIIFQKKSQIIFTGPARGKYWDIIKIFNSSNVRIVNANIKGSRYSKEEQTGEWSAGISILNSQNVIIENPKIADTYGDGIFIGSEDFGFSENIRVNGGFINNVRRNGISVNSAKDVYINNVLISNTNGTAPEAGIDLEPSIEQQIIKNINLSNIYTFNNAVSGIAINMNYLSVDHPKEVKSVLINITNHIDNRSPNAFGTSLNDSKKLYDAKGIINITNPTWENNKELYWKSNTKQSIIINFKNIKTSNTTKYKNLENFLKKQSNVSIK